MWLDKTILSINTFILSFFTYYPIEQTFDNYGGYRIDNIYSPSKYSISLNLSQSIFSGESEAFSGNIRIIFQVTSATSQIQLHDIANYTSVGVTQTNTGAAVSISSYKTYNASTQIRTILLGQSLTAGVNYTLAICYTGTLRNAYSPTANGLYVSTYKNSARITEYMVTSQLQAFSARHAFPCFDEPNLKAVFKTRITYPKELKAQYNTAQIYNVTVDDTYITTTFAETPKMSTYLNAFIVSNFTCTKAHKTDLNIPIQVCSQQGEEQFRDFALEVGTPIMKYLENITGIKYANSFSKMDQMAIPDFPAGAMENWGLVTSRKTNILWSPAESSNIFKQRIAQVIAHEFAHMWFGNLVTCDWWDYLFLNEGFATLWQYFAAIPVSRLSTWELEKQFVVEQVHSALLTDSGSTPAITARAANRAELTNKIPTIFYNKAACILRMAENFLGSDNFIYGLRSYLNTYAYKSTVPVNLWTSLGEYATRKLPTGVSLNNTMANWIDQPGYPLITVTVSENDVILSQKRFRLNGNSDSTEWYVPITYTVSKDTSTFSDTMAKAWLIPGQNLTLCGVLNESSWIILNNQESSFYRINYEDQIWANIKSTLQTNHTIIDVLNRAQLVDDTYNFARGGLISYIEALERFSYLKNEVEYYPLFAADAGMIHLFQTIGYESSEGKRAMTHFLSAMEKVYAIVPFGSLNSNDQVYTMKQELVLTRACRWGKSDCIKQVKKLFTKYKRGTSVPKNLRNIVYCNALRYSDNITIDFNFLWNKYQQTSLASEIVTILGSFGCAQNSALLKWFLKQTINATSGIRTQDLGTAWFSVYANGGKIGATAAMEFILEEYSALTSYYTSVDSLISNIATYFYLEDQLYTLENLINSTTVSTSHKNTAQSALARARLNINWSSTLKGNLTSFFDNLESSSTSSTQRSVLLISVAFLLQFLLLK